VSRRNEVSKWKRRRKKKKKKKQELSIHGVGRRYIS
jgi:hypothetical protein